MALFVFSLFVLAFFAVARKAKPANDQAGGYIEAPQNSSNKDCLVVATYNIQTGKSLEGKRDITRSAGVAKQADIVGVQEVYAASWLNRLGLGKSQTQILASIGDFAGIFAATRYRWFREHRGNALLTRLPVESWQVKMLPDYSGKSYRNMMIAYFKYKGERVCIINTHLHTREGRQEQLSIVLNEFAKHPKAILLGDFNSTESEALLQQALAEESVIDAIAAVSPQQDQGRIDWVLVRGFDVVDGMIIEKGVSDHPYYQVSLK